MSLEHRAHLESAQQSRPAAADSTSSRVAPPSIPRFLSQPAQPVRLTASLVVFGAAWLGLVALAAPAWAETASSPAIPAPAYLDPAVHHGDAPRAAGAADPSAAASGSSFDPMAQSPADPAAVVTPEYGEHLARVGTMDDEEDDGDDGSPDGDESGSWIGETPPAHKPRPLVVPEHKKVDQVLKYFLTKRRAILEQGYRRSGKYLPMIRQIFAEEGIPAEMAYLAAVESNYNPVAHSRAKAAGLWQFMRGTAKKYGLRVNLPWYDERLDPVYATRAAARLLADLHDRFGNWELAMAGYNAGEGRVSRAIRKARQPEGEENFWTLRRLPRETKGYVPSFFALARIYADPEKYELSEIELEQPVAIEAVKIDQPTTLEELARRLDLPKEDLARLNPAWKRGVIPPARFEPVLLHVPEGQGERLTASLANEPLPEVNWREHIVSRGDTLSSIARMYRVPLQELMTMNAGSARRLSIGQSVMLPVPKGGVVWATADVEIAPRPRKVRVQAAPAPRVQPVALAATVADTQAAPGGAAGTHRVQAGDTLWSISQRYNVTIQQLKRWNQLRSSRLHPDRDLIVQNPGPQ